MVSHTIGELKKYLIKMQIFAVLIAGLKTGSQFKRTLSSDRAVILIDIFFVKVDDVLLKYCVVKILCCETK